MRPIRSVLHALLYSNVFIACCALGFALAHLLLLRHEGPYWPLLSLVFGGTLSGYLALRLEGSRRLNESGHLDRLLWVQRHLVWAWLLLGGGALLALLGFAHVQAETRLAVVPAVVLMLAYGWPFLPIPPRFRLRRRPYWKIFLIAAVWAWVGLVLPLVESGLGSLRGLPLMHWSLALPLLGRFLFVLAITLPFDIRDIEVDRVLRVQTLPAWLGARKSIQLSRILLVCSQLLVLPSVLWPLSIPPCRPGQAWEEMLQSIGFVELGLLILPQLLLTLLTMHWVGRSKPMAARTAATGAAQGHMEVPDCSTERTSEEAFLYLGLLDGTLLLHALCAAAGLWGSGLLPCVL